MACRTVFLDAVRGMNDVTVRGSEGGMPCSTFRPSSRTTAKFAWAFLDAEKVGVMPGSSFGRRPPTVHISLCQPEDVLREAASRLRRFVSSYRNKAA